MPENRGELRAQAASQILRPVANVSEIVRVPFASQARMLTQPLSPIPLADIAPPKCQEFIAAAEAADKTNFWLHRFGTATEADIINDRVEQCVAVLERNMVQNYFMFHTLAMNGVEKIAFLLHSCALANKAKLSLRWAEFNCDSRKWGELQLIAAQRTIAVRFAGMRCKTGTFSVRGVASWWGSIFVPRRYSRCFRCLQFRARGYFVLPKSSWPILQEMDQRFRKVWFGRNRSYCE